MLLILIVMIISIYSLANYNYTLNYTSYRLLLCLLLMILVFKAYTTEPTYDWDLYRHFELLSEARYSPSLELFIDNISNFEYSGLYVYNIIMYFLSKSSDDNQIVPAFFVFIDYAILMYIFYDWQKTNPVNGRQFLLSFMISFSFMPFIYADSGLRNGIAMSLTALAIYLHLYKNKSIVYYVIGVSISALIHPVVLFTFPFVFLSSFSPYKYGPIMCVAIFFLSKATAMLLMSSSVPYLSLIGLQYYMYTNLDREVLGVGRVYIYPVVYTLCLLIYMLYRNKKYIIDKFEIHKMRNFILWYAFFVLGNSQYYDLVLRPSYLFAFFSFFLAYIFTVNNGSLFRLISVITTMLLAYVSLTGLMIL